jgi:TRAP-type C4-dicarboxylate transport system substrate-binding protein
MKSVIFFLFAIAGILVVAIYLAPADSLAADKPFILRISHSTTPEDFMYKGFVQFIEKIEARSKGRIKCEHYHSSQLTVDRTSMVYVRDNLTQLGSAPAGIIATVAGDYRWNVFSQPWFADGNWDTLYKVADGKTGALLYRDLEKKFNYKIYGMYNLGWSDIGNTKRLVKSLPDLKGLKIRVAESPIWLGIFNALGCNATPMNFGEVYTALQQKTIDGLATIANLFITTRFTDFVKYITELGISGSEHVMYMNRQFYDSLPPDLQKILDETLMETMVWLRKAAEKAQEEVYGKFEKQGIQVSRMTPEFLATCKATQGPVLEKYFTPQIGKKIMEMSEYDKKFGKRGF